MARILVVDDEVDVLTTIQQILERAGHSALMASSGEQALSLMSSFRPDLIVLDIIMPGMSGIVVCQRIRADPFFARTPILFLTARSRPADVAEGLDIGGDDYLTKPFEVVELPARVRALLRRGPGGSLDAFSDTVSLGDITLSPKSFTIQVGGRDIELRPAEHRLLHYLMLRPDHPTPVEELLEAVWEYPAGCGDPAIVYVHISNLREKIEDDFSSEPLIRNIRGRGYLIIANAVAPSTQPQ